MRQYVTESMILHVTAKSSMILYITSYREYETICMKLYALPLFTVRIWGASSYETRRANDTASILVLINLLKATDLPSMAIGNSLFQMFCHVRNESY